MKTFYTERDIVDMYTAGVRQLEINDDIVLTDLARDKAQELGISLTSTHQPPAPPAASPAGSPSGGLSQAELAARIKSGVIARLGTDEYNNILDRVIPQVLARLNAPDAPDKTASSQSAY